MQNPNPWSGLFKHVRIVYSVQHRSLVDYEQTIKVEEKTQNSSIFTEPETRLISDKFRAKLNQPEQDTWDSFES